ncbi:hypothetical protein EDD86DRAFT_198346 [Gorgonomyces haynaldii]|nr:hypothetical protein EDD86DRAFT_198346 [Gorgonomyces haynaldii]
MCCYCCQINCPSEVLAHHKKHSNKKSHPISVNLGTLEFWCFSCEQVIVGQPDANQLVMEATKVLKQSHPEHMPPSAEPVERPSVKLEPAKNPGLTNLGNTCFFNAVLQCLVYTPALRDFVSNHSIKINPNDNPVTVALFSLLETMGEASHSENRLTINPKQLLDSLSVKWPLYKNYQQQDGHELLRRLLEVVEEEHEQKDENGKVIEQPTFLDAIFQGHLVSVIVCDTCKHVSYSYEQFMDISLPIIKASQAKNGLKQFLTNMIRTPPSLRKSVGATSPKIHPDVDKEHSDQFASLTKDLDTLRLSRSRSGTGESTDMEDQEINKRIALIQSLLRPLTVYVADGNPEITMEQCLQHFLKLEILQGDNAWSCDNCYNLKHPDDKIVDPPRKASAQFELLQVNLPPSKLIELPTVPSLDQFVEEESDAESTGSDSTSSASVKDEQPKEPERKRKYPPVHSKAFKRYLLYDLPEVMVMHLKRFHHTGQGYRASKRDDHVRFDEYLDFSAFMAPMDMPPRKKEDDARHRTGGTYRAYGVVVHSGTLYGGHYVAYVRLDDQRWAYCSDSVVSLVTWEAVAKSQAYIVFYHRFEKPEQSKEQPPVQ